MIADIIRITSRRAVPVARLCDRLVLSEKELAAIVKKAREDGYSVRIRDGFVSSKIALGAIGLVTLGTSQAGRHKAVQITDTHFGSRHCDEDGILDCLNRAWDRGARFGIHTGDMLDGNKEVLIPDQDYCGFDRQYERAERVFKKAPPFAWVAISGNHDGYFDASMGCVSGKIVEARLRDAGVKWSFAGVCAGKASIQGASFFLWHPHGAGSSRNNVRRVLNDKAESLEEPSDFLLGGHYHRFVSFLAFPEDTYCVGGGTFQRKRSEFANRITKPWDIGAPLVSWTLTRNGAVIEKGAEFLSAKGI